MPDERANRYNAATSPVPLPEPDATTASAWATAMTIRGPASGNDDVATSGCAAMRVRQIAQKEVPLLCCRSVRTIDVCMLGEHLGSNRITVEGPGNARIRRKVDECLHDLLWRHPAVQSNP